MLPPFACCPQHSTHNATHATYAAAMRGAPSHATLADPGYTLNA